MEDGETRQLHQEDRKNNNIIRDVATSEDVTTSGSLPSFHGFVEDNMLDLSEIQQEYIDPSDGYEFVNADVEWPSNLDNSDALLDQLTALGIRVPKDYITLDLEETTNSRSISVSSSSADDVSWLDEEIYVESLATCSEEHRTTGTKSSTEEDGKVAYEDFPKDYRSPISSQADFQEYLRLVQSHDDVTSTGVNENKINQQLQQKKKLSSTQVVGLLRNKLSGLRLLANVKAKIRKFKARDSSFDVLTPDSGVHDNFAALTVEEQEKQRDEWKSDLAKTEDEIQTLRQVLASKVKHAQDLKRRLGVTVWREFSDDISTSLRSVKESPTVQKVNEVVGDFSDAVTGAPLVIKANAAFAEFKGAVASAPMYQKTAGAMSAVSEKTGAIFGGIGAKFGQLKETQTFKSFEERVGSVYTTARSKMTGSESNSTQDFEEALREAEAEKAASTEANGTPASTAVTTTPPDQTNTTAS